MRLAIPLHKAVGPVTSATTGVATTTICRASLTSLGPMPFDEPVQAIPQDPLRRSPQRDPLPI